MARLDDLLKGNVVTAVGLGVVALAVPVVFPALGSCRATATHDGEAERPSEAGAFSRMSFSRRPLLITDRPVWRRSASANRPIGQYHRK